MTTTNPTETNDAAARFSLLEMDDGPRRPVAPAAAPVVAPVSAPAVPAPAVAAPAQCGCGASRPLAVRGVCPRCGGRVPTPVPSPRATTPVPAGFESTVAATAREGGEAQSALVAGQLIAGAVATGHGVLVSWSGKGELTRGQILECLETAKLPADWAPTARSAHAQAGHAVDTLNGRGYVARSARSGGKTAEERGWRARWTVGTVSAGASVGAAYGETVLVATLASDSALVLDGQSDLAAEVRVEFDRLTAGEIVGSADVTAWLRGVLVGRLGSVRLGGSYYVPRASVAQAVAICEAVSAIWGCDWMLPALPIATSEQLQRGLANGLTAEAATVLDDLATARAVAAKDGKAEIGGRAAATLLAKLRTVAERAQQYQALLGDDCTRQVRTAVAAAIETVMPLVSDTTQRGALIWADIAGSR